MRAFVARRGAANSHCQPPCGMPAKPAPILSARPHLVLSTCGGRRRAARASDSGCCDANASICRESAKSSPESCRQAQLPGPSWGTRVSPFASACARRAVSAPAGLSLPSALVRVRWPSLRGRRLVGARASVCCQGRVPWEVRVIWTVHVIGVGAIRVI
jgi:hypothetical protein